MRARKLTLPLAGLAVAAMVAGMAPAHAGSDIGENQGTFFGTVASSDNQVDVNAGIAVHIDGGCTFTGTLTPPPNSQLVIEYAGYDAATGTGGVNGTTPIYTDITCTITNVPSGGSNTESFSVRTSGSASASAGSTLTSTSGPKMWPVLPVTVCVSGKAEYGPINPFTLVLHQKCQPLNLPIP